MGRQPPINTPINRSHPLGKHIESIIIPGWSEAEASSGTGSGAIYRELPGGKRKKLSIFEANADASTATVTKKNLAYRNGQTVTAIEALPDDNDSGFYFRNTDSDYGPDLGTRNFSVVAIFKPNNDGRPGTGDPRIYSKDFGSDLNDHDLMVGLVGGGTYVVPRMRIAGTANSYTLAGNGAASADQVDQDNWNLIAGSLTGNDNMRLSWINASGYGENNDGADTGGYTPRNTTAEGLWNTVGDTAEDTNLFDGTILCVYFFRGIVLDEPKLRSLFDDPWQIFERRTILVPTFPYLPYTPYDPNAAPPSPVTITDVNTTESWNDGDTGLVITGTGFM